MKTIGIIQPNYLPWRGYFDFISEVDTFVFLDDVKYTEQDWRNRNRVRLKSGGTAWLTVPVRRTDRRGPIREVRIDASKNWARRHLETLRMNYSGTAGFASLFPILEEHLGSPPELLADLDIRLTVTLARLLGIDTEFVRSSDLAGGGHKDTRLISLVERLGGTRYLSGPSALSYLQPELWQDAGIELAIKSYDGYAPYRQIAEPFEPFVSVIDLMFMTGTAARDFLSATRTPSAN